LGVADLLAYGLVVALLLLARRRAWILAGLGVLALGIIVRLAVRERERSVHQNTFWVEALDVGHGDAICINIPPGRIILVDGGGIAESAFDVGRSIWLPYLRERNISAIDVLLVTHPHPDHYLGFRTLIQQRRVSEFWFNGEHSRNENWQEFFANLKSQGIPTLALHRRVLPQNIGEAKITFVNPPFPLYSAEKKSSLNNRSLAFLLEIYGRAFLFTGDIEREAESAIQEFVQQTLLSTTSSRLFPITLLKVPHHGSKTSSSRAFLEFFQPQVAIVSAGWLGRHHFPHAAVERRYQSLGIPLFSTERCGALRLSLKNSGSLALSSYRKNCSYSF
jgi:competence protein ComEC